MLELGSLVTRENATGCTYFIVTKFGAHTILEKLDDFIMRNYTVSIKGVSLTLEEILENEKQKILKRGVADVPYN